MKSLEKIKPIAVWVVGKAKKSLVILFILGIKTEILIIIRRTIFLLCAEVATPE